MILLLREVNHFKGKYIIFEWVSIKLIALQVYNTNNFAILPVLNGKISVILDWLSTWTGFYKVIHRYILFSHNILCRLSTWTGFCFVLALLPQGFSASYNNRATNNNACAQDIYCHKTQKWGVVVCFFIFGRMRAVVNSAFIWT